METMVIVSIDSFECHLLDHHIFKVTDIEVVL